MAVCISRHTAVDLACLDLQTRCYHVHMSAKSDSEFVVANEALFGVALQEFRARQNMSQAELAERLGLHRSYLSALENGRSNKAMRVLMRAFRDLGLEVVVRPRS